MIRVVICDDHPIVRSGLRAILGAEANIQVAGEATSHADLRECLKETPCDVLLLDIELPGRNGIEILEQLRRQQRPPAVLVMSIYPEDQYALRALRAGAAGYLNKNSAPEKLIEAVRALGEGRRYISAGVSALLAEAVAGDGQKAAHELLSDREFQVMRMIASGKQLSEIAAEIALSPKTVSVYRARILEKMKLRNNVALARYAEQHGLI